MVAIMYVYQVNFAKDSKYKTY